MDEAAPVVASAYENFKKQTKANQKKILILILCAYCEKGYSKETAWNKTQITIMLGLHQDNLLSKRLGKLKSSGGDALKLPDPKIDELIQDLSSPASITIAYLKDYTSTDLEVSKAPSSGEDGISSDVEGASKERLLVRDPPTSKEGKPLSADGETPPTGEKIDLKTHLLTALTTGKDFLWTHRNAGQITGMGASTVGGLVSAFGLFAGTAVINTGVSSILPSLFTAWAISHGVPPAAIAFYLLGAFLVAAGLITLGASTLYQKCHTPSSISA